MNAMDIEAIKQEVLRAEDELLSKLRSGDIWGGVAMHLDAPEYHNIWNGEDKSHTMLRARIEKGLEMGLASFDYQVSARDFLFIDNSNVLETLTAVPVTVLETGERIPDGQTMISILWRKLDGAWRLAYLHASELPKE